MFAFLVAALALGIRHALDPDHLVAVSVMVAQQRHLWTAARLGLAWGLGHMVLLAVLGLPVLLLRWELPAALEHVVDLGVGLMLVILGVRTVWWPFGRAPGHAHGHSSGGSRSALATFAMGCVHGLAGSGAVALIAMTVAPSPASGVLYLLVFGIGTCVGMFAMTLCLAAPAVTGLARLPGWQGTVRAVSGLASFAVGAFMWYDTLPQLLS